jgi:DNA-binding NarL/FixJ family response regulator
MRNPHSNQASRTVFVVGENTLQNELIASALQEETGLPCLEVKDLTQVEPFPEEDEKSACLALYDCFGKDGKACLADLEGKAAHKDFMLALFNLDRNVCLEREAVSCGARGFFYSGDPFGLFVRGVLGIFEGEFWISRLLLSKWVSQENAPSRRLERDLLSGPERKILYLMSGGAANKEIADALCMNPNTVKKHFKEIFRKIDVHNKTEAFLWARRHINF